LAGKGGSLAAKLSSSQRTSSWSKLDRAKGGSKLDLVDSSSSEETRGELASDCRKLATTLGEAFSRNLCLVKSLKSDMELKTACLYENTLDV
jgi:hypothetical protein